MQVGRTIEQLKKRRHAYLGPYVPPPQERRIQRVDPAEEVGQLKGDILGDKRALVITLGEDFWVGRHPGCDLVIDHPTISNFHLRIYAQVKLRTSSLICVHDLSTNGFILNDTTYKSTQTYDIGGVKHSTRCIIIRPGDILRFPDSPIELSCRYFSHHSEPTQAQYEGPGQVRCEIPALFPSSDASEPLEAGPWRICNFTLGTGSFGRVHLATNIATPGLQVACKTARFNKQIEVEISVMKGLAHPNICGIYDMVREDEGEVIHLFLPLVTGGDLFSYLEKHLYLTEDEGKFAAYQLLKALEFLYGKGIAHRDVKPENVLLHKSGAFPHLLLADFGLATTRDQVLHSVPWDRNNLVERNHRIFTGTSTYIPPERLKAILGRKRSTVGLAESVHGGIVPWREAIGKLWFEEEAMLDRWAFGIVLYTLMTGAHPYDERLDHEVFDRTATDNSQMTAATSRRRTSAQSWNEFRSRNPNGTVGDGPQSEQEAEWRRVESRCSRFGKLRPDYWQPEERWVGISAEGRDFVAQLLSPHATKRVTLAEAFTHTWLSDQQAALDNVYRTVVTQGKLERASIWNRNGGVAPFKKSIIVELDTTPPEQGPSGSEDVITATTALAPSHATKSPADTVPVLEPTKTKRTKQTKRKDSHDDPATEKPKKKSKSKKAVAAAAAATLGEAGDTTDPVDASVPSSSKPTHLPKKKPGPKPKVTTKKAAAPPRRPSSLFLPDGGIFGELDDIAEENEEAGEDERARREAEEAMGSLGGAAMTLNDLLSAGPGEASGSGSGTGGMAGMGGGAQTQGEQESMPPIKAGQRKSILAKKGVGVKPISKTSLFATARARLEEETLRPSDLASSLQATPSASTSKPSSQVQVGKTITKRPGVVLKRVEKAGAK
ncbi:kinase-like domain-containing protein [Dioszegia hungarica]|uniref:Kinase-like domain-containing protein n=1 Tax=Dioszegia hungarica TaxID=4972 RepID=A0AA38H8Y0_9TREE|nr:kinase-like domain-containing protein [Dioszegia hungarica]KAI9636127.1 kinase-like domain-containing protein [Dioszegia hungarica]